MQQGMAGGFPGGDMMGGGRGGQGGGFPGGGGVGMGQQGGRGMELDPLVGLIDTRKPLRSKLLAVPSLKAKYLQDVRTIAAESLDWSKLGVVVAQYRTLIDKEIQMDTRKLESYDAFKRAVADTASTVDNNSNAGNPPRQGSVSVRTFADQRRAFLLKNTAGAAFISKAQTSGK